MRIRFKSAWKDGTHSVLLDPLDFVSRLCPLIPPPRFHMLRYHGVLAGHSRDRAEVVPQESAKDESSLEPSSDAQQLLFEPAPPLQPPPSRHPWAWLLRRVFAGATDIRGPTMGSVCDSTSSVSAPQLTVVATPKIRSPRHAREEIVGILLCSSRPT
ncbi:MAG: hypothetical protein ACI9KE_003489 [Polyangiales bacterium]